MSDGSNRQDSHSRNPFKGRRPPLRWDEGTEDEILRYLRGLASRLGKDTVTTRDVQKDGQVSPATIHRRFGGFSEALIRAGLRPLRTYKRNRAVMLQQLEGLMTELGRVPSKTEVGKNLSYSVRHFETEFGSLKKACELAKSMQPDSDRRDRNALTPLRLTRTKTRRHYGPDIDFRGLRHAPINELGVVFLFGMLAEELGFVVESVQDRFPDCSAKRRLPDGTFEGVSVEFEFRSSDFPRHRHDPASCDIIVCWLHDWSNCPIQVIALSEVIKGLRGSTRDA